MSLIVDQITARWTTPHSELAWAQVCLVGQVVRVVSAEKAKLDEDEIRYDPGAILEVILGPMLPAGEPERVAQVTVSRSRGDETLEWKLVLAPVPESPAPEGVHKINDRIGGPEGLAALVAKAVDSMEDISAQYTVAMVVDGTAFRLSFIPSGFSAAGLPKTLRDSAQEVLVESIGFRMVAPKGPVEEVWGAYYHQVDEYSLRCHGTHEVVVWGEGMWCPPAWKIQRFAEEQLIEPITTPGQSSASEVS